MEDNVLKGQHPQYQKVPTHERQPPLWYLSIKQDVYLGHECMDLRFYSVVGLVGMFVKLFLKLSEKKNDQNVITVRQRIGSIEFMEYPTIQ
jgi:hypothetical protein